MVGGLSGSLEYYVSAEELVGLDEQNGATHWRATSRRWNLGSKSLIPRSNWVRFSYARTSLGFCANSAARSLRLKAVCLHSLHILISILIAPVSFSVLLLSGLMISCSIRSWIEKLASRNVQANLTRATCLWIAAYYSSACPAVMPSEIIAGKLLLTERTSRDSSIFFPSHYRLLQLFPLGFHGR